MRTFMTVVFVSAMATACVGEPDVSTRTQGVVEANTISANGIVLNGIVLNGIVLNGIVLNQLSADTFTLIPNGLMETDEGRQILRYVISCAIPSGITFVAEYDGVSYQFLGDIGLAPAWMDRGLRETEQRWVSACLISRVNRFGVPVSISIRGPHKALKVSESEAYNYVVEEGAFYGNVFQAVDGAPIIWNACSGRDQSSGSTGTLELRDCAKPDPANPGYTLCGFTYTGPCADWVPPPNAYACKKFRSAVDRLATTADYDQLSSLAYHGGYYEDCYDSPGLGQWQGAERFSEVITVFLTP
jgi:hypothetical protein